MLNINSNIDAQNATLSLGGRLDTTTAPEFEAAVKALPENVTALVIDMEALDYISSAGLRVLLVAQKTMLKKGSMKVVHINETVMEIFEVTGFADILTIE